MAEWLRRYIINPVAFPRVGSNPADYVMNAFLLEQFKAQKACDLRNTMSRNEKSRLVERVPRL
ncbi:hypothetical protein chiPu_0022734, partial [Chiloscyllium punctatum]|nr:hypothetical protein [Chiloscyllium punctatum]